MDDRQLLSIVNSEFATAMGAQGGEISEERAKAWNYYLSKKLGNEVEGQSQVVSSDVAEVVDGIMPSLLRLFTTSENMMTFDAVGPEDEAQAAQESDYVSHVFFKKNPSFITMFFWFFDALVQKNGIVKAWWDESEKVTTEGYQNLSEEDLIALVEDEELEPIERAENIVDGEVLHDIQFRRVSKQGRVRYECVPPEEYRISGDSRTLDPSDARMVGQEREIKRSDLIDMGFDKALVETLSATTEVHGTAEEIARRDKTDENFDVARDRSQDKIEVRECYIKVDYDDDGRSELRQVFVAGNHILSNEPVDRQPFHIICPQPLPHKHFGQAWAEKVMDTHEITTTLERQILDNLYHTNNPGNAVWEEGMSEDTFDDLLVTRIGRTVRFDRPPGEAWMPMTVPFTAAATFPMLAYYDKIKRDRTGISSDSEGLSPDDLKNIQRSVMAQATDLSKMKIEAVARIFAETGIKSLFLHIHELLLKHQNKEEVVRLRNEWIPIDPRSWRTRENLTVSIGLGVASSEQKLIHLESIWSKQAEIITSGGAGLLVTPKNIFNTAAEFVKAANIKGAELFFTDPGDAEMPQNNEQAELQKQQQQLIERQQQLEAAKQQLNEEKERFRQQAETAKIELQREKQMDEKVLKLEEISQNVMVSMEKIANELTALELKHGTNVPGARV
jgi:hypothetical protein